MGIDNNKYDGKLTKDGQVVSTYGETANSYGDGVNCINFKGEYILELFKKEEKNNEKTKNQELLKKEEKNGKYCRFI